MDDLPKIDWPKQPSLFRRELKDYATDLNVAVPCPDCARSHTVLDLLRQILLQKRTGTTTSLYRPQDIPEFHAATTPSPTAQTGPAGGRATSKQEFRGASMPEITPFANQALPSEPPAPAARSARGGQALTANEAVSRLNELFPEDETTGFMPDNNDITSILNRLLPDEEDAAASANGAQPAAAPVAANIATGYSVFLAKIGDDARRVKAVPLLVELARITTEEAEALSRKVIIPVIKGVTKEEAEAAKQRFAKIGILARIKGADAG